MTVVTEPADVSDDSATIYVPTLIRDGEIVAPGSPVPWLHWLDDVE